MANKTWQVNSQVTIWVILIAGVLVMAYMAWQLMRSIENKTREEDGEFERSNDSATADKGKG